MNRLKELRLANKISQEKVSEDTGISRAMLYYLETGKRPMRLQHAQVLAPYFGVSIDYMMGSDAIYFAGSFEGALDNLLNDTFDMVVNATKQGSLDERTRLIYAIAQNVLSDKLTISDLKSILAFIVTLIKDHEEVHR